MQHEGIIEHKGKVVGVHPDSVEVSVHSETACATCHAKSICGTDAGKEKLILVMTPEAPYYHEGEEVVVSIGRAMGFQAVTIAYILPFVFVLAMLLILLHAGYGELLSGGSALGVLCLYYLMIYLFRSRIAKEITFKIRKKES